MTKTVKYRHELKYFISTKSYIALKSRLISLMNTDPHANRQNQYHIRSLYFDDICNSAFYDKLSGVEQRKKYRIRIYNHQDDLIKLERKGKTGQYTLKESEVIPITLCKDILSGQIDSLKSSGSVLLQDLFVQMKTVLLKPVVLVDYVREAYVHPFENVRITFDMKLKTGLYSTDLFNPSVPVVDALEPGTIIMEVKFNQFLPSHVQKLISGVKNERDSISKYILCRDLSQRNIRGEWNG